MRCVAQCPSSKKYHIQDSRVCIEDCPEGQDFVIDGACHFSCGDLYYYPTKDQSVTECRREKCIFSRRTEFGNECRLKPLDTFMRVLSVPLAILQIMGEVALGVRK